VHGEKHENDGRKSALDPEHPKAVRSNANAEYKTAAQAMNMDLHDVLRVRLRIQQVQQSVDVSRVPRWHVIQRVDDDQPVNDSTDDTPPHLVFEPLYAPYSGTVQRTRDRESPSSPACYAFQFFIAQRRPLDYPDIVVSATWSASMAACVPLRRMAGVPFFISSKRFPLPCRGAQPSSVARGRALH
jgi:hypothetical protein